MAQPIPRKTLPWKGHAGYTLVDVDDRAEENAQRRRYGSRREVTFAEETEEENEEGEGEGDDNDDNDKPTSCVGHFDRLDVDPTQKPTMQARVYVFHEEQEIATWSGTPLLQQNEVSRHWDSVVAARKRSRLQAELEESGTEGRRTPPAKSGPRIVFPVPSGDDEEDDGVLPSSSPLQVEEPRRRLRSSHTPTTSSSSPPSPKRVLKKLRVSRTAVRLPEGEDPFFAGRLAATCVIMVREGLLVEAERLGRWSVNLVGKRGWDKMVEDYGSAPRLDTDDRDWMSSMLDDVDISLQPIDGARAAELRGMAFEWRNMGILPSERSTTTSEAT